MQTRFSTGPWLIRVVAFALCVSLCVVVLSHVRRNMMIDTVSQTLQRGAALSGAPRNETIMLSPQSDGERFRVLFVLCCAALRTGRFRTIPAFGHLCGPIQTFAVLAGSRLVLSWTNCDREFDEYLRI